MHTQCLFLHPYIGHGFYSYKIMKLSIIIPAYKVEAYISKCIYSAENQDISVDEFEVVIIDDGSPDRSAEIATKIAEEFSNIRVISQDNGGLSAARNTGILHAQGDYIMFLDSDDWIEPNCLGKLTRRCYEDNLDLLQICAADVYDGVSQRRFCLNETLGVRKGADVLKNEIQVCAPFAIYKRALLNDNNLRFYLGIYHEDNEFTPRAYYMANRVGCTNDIIYYVCQNPNSITRTINPKKAYDLLVVMRQLYKFMDERVATEDKQSFVFQLCQDLNACLRETYHMKNDDIKQLNEYIYQQRELLRCLRMSNSIAYRMEGVFMKLFPKNVIKIYKALNLIDPRKKDASRI